MKAGFYTTDITPSIGMKRPCHNTHYIDTIHDNLKVRAAVISDGKETVALVGIDTCVLQSSDIVKTIRKEIEERTGIKGKNVMIGASHTHQGGPLIGLMEKDYSGAPELIRKLISEYPGYIGVADPLYCQHVAGQTVTAVCEAFRRREEVLISCGAGFEDKVAFNRRFRMKNGRTYTHPGKGNPDIIEPAGPVDPGVGVLSAWDKNGELLGCIVNYACHGTTSPFSGARSADWIYFLEKRICGAMNSEATVVFLNGASGDVTQINNLSLNEQESGDKYSDFVGSRVGAEAIKVMVSAEKGDYSPVGGKQKILKLKRRKPSQKRLEESMEIVESGMKNSQFDTQWIFAGNLLVTDFLVTQKPETEVEVQGIQVGAAVFLASPAELFCQLGLNIKKASPFPLTFVAELANGTCGYIPDKEAFSAKGGGYETVLTNYSNMEISTGEKIVAASLEIANSLKPGKIPQPEQVKKSLKTWPGAPWDYGVLGPDLE